MYYKKCIKVFFENKKKRRLQLCKLARRYLHSIVNLNNLIYVVNKNDIQNKVSTKKTLL